MKSVGIFFCNIVFGCLLVAIPGSGADFNIQIHSGGGSQTVTIVNTTSFPAHVHDVRKADGTAVVIDKDVISSITAQVPGDLTGIVEVRCQIASGSSNPDPAAYLAHGDGYYHFSAAATVGAPPAVDSSAVYSDTELAEMYVNDPASLPELDEETLKRISALAHLID